MRIKVPVRLKAEVQASVICAHCDVLLWAISIVVSPTWMWLMAFSEEQKRAILNRLSQRIRELPKCSICAATDWIVGDYVFAVGTGSPREVAPNIPLICKNCGNTHLLNAMVLDLKGLLDSGGLGPAELPS